MAVGEFADLGPADAGHREFGPAVPPDLRALTGQQIGEPGHLGPPHRDLRAEPGAPELRHRLVRRHPSPVQGHHPVGELRGLLRGAGGDQDRPPLRGEGPQEGVEPLHVARREAFGGRVQEQRAGLSEQGGRQGEPPVHARRVGAQALLGDGREPGPLQELVRPPGGHADRGGQHPEVPPGLPAGVPGEVGRPGGVDRSGQEHTDLALRPTQPPVGAAGEEGDALAPFEFQHQPQRGRLARSLGSQQGRHRARAGLEGQIQQHRGASPSVNLGQSGDLDHRWLLPCPRPTWSAARRVAPARFRASTLGARGGDSGHYGSATGRPPAHLTRSGENPILRPRRAVRRRGRVRPRRGARPDR